MKRFMMMFVSILAVSLIMSTMTIAQDKKTAQEKKEDPKKAKISENFLATWQKVGNMTKEIRSFKTEKAVTVAGVRGAEAEDVALKFLYYKGGVVFPNLLEMMNAIEILENFVKYNPDDSTVVEKKYYIAQMYVQIGDIDKGTKVYNEVIEISPKSEYAVLAKEELDKIKKS